MLRVMQRLPSIDIMRTIAIVFMVLCHSVILLCPPSTSDALTYFFANHIIGDFGAPFFLLLVGVSFAISSQGNASMESPGAMTRRNLKRGAIIFFGGIAFAVLLRGPSTAFDWDVLPLIGTSICVLTLIYRLPSSSLLAISFLVILLTPFLRAKAGTLALWGGRLDVATGSPALIASLILDPVSEYQAPFTLAAMLSGFLVNGYFPVFPWLALPLAGFVAGRSLKTNTPKQYFSLVVPLGLILIILSWVIASYFSTNPPDTSVFGPFTFYPVSPSMLSLQIGVGLCLLGALHLLADTNKPTGFGALCERLSRYSLSIYVVHHCLLVWPVRVIGSILVGPPTGMGVGFLILIFAAFATNLWDRWQGKYSFEWWLAQATRKTYHFNSDNLSPTTKAGR
jgi:uncharacterized membrane protein